MSSIFDSKENALNLVSKMAPNSSSLIGNSSSGVIIQQIGDSNTINANLKTATSTANFTAIQNGDLNLMNGWNLKLTRDFLSIGEKMSGHASALLFLSFLFFFFSFFFLSLLKHVSQTNF